MPFIGKEPQNHYITPTKDRFSGDASTVAFTLSRPVALPSDLEVFVDNVQQEPTSAYTINNTTLTFTGTPATGTNNIYAIHRGGGMQTLQPQDGQAGDFSTVNISSDLSVTGNITTDVTMTGTTPTLTIGDAGAEDTKIVFDGNAQDYYVALDDSADKLLLGLGSTVGTTPAISIDANLLVTTFGDVTMTGATPTLTIGDAGAEDAKIVFDGNAQDFHIGLDDSADDLVIGLGSALGTTPAISIAETLKTSFGGATVGKTSVDATNTGNVTLDFDANSNFILTFTGNVTLVNPTTESVGQSGIIVIIQDGTGSRTIATGTQFEWPAGTEPAISTAANSVDILPYFIDAADSILLGNPQLAFATPS